MQTCVCERGVIICARHVFSTLKFLLVERDKDRWVYFSHIAMARYSKMLNYVSVDVIKRWRTEPYIEPYIELSIKISILNTQILLFVYRSCLATKLIKMQQDNGPIS